MPCISIWVSCIIASNLPPPPCSPPPPQGSPHAHPLTALQTTSHLATVRLWSGDKQAESLIPRMQRALCSVRTHYIPYASPSVLHAVLQVRIKTLAGGLHLSS